MARQETRQVTFDGLAVPALPFVRTTDGHIVEWDRQRIVNQIVKETRLVETFYGYEGATEEIAQEIALDVENRIKNMGLKSLSGPLIREIVNITLLEKGMVQYRNVSTRVGTPVYDAHLIDVGKGFEAHDNANLQENAETSHKKKADKISKEQYLLQLPPDLADHHLSGEMHIHDLEYFGTRPFCQDWDLRYFFYYGLMPDGNGTKASVAGPASGQRWQSFTQSRLSDLPRQTSPAGRDTTTSSPSLRPTWKECPTRRSSRWSRCSYTR